MHEWARGKKGARTNENEEEAIKSIAKRQDVWEEAGIKDVDLSYLVHAGPDDTFSSKRKLYSGHTLRFGEDPRRVDQSLQLDKDMEVVAVLDDDFIDHLGVIPLKFGSFYWYADAASFDIATSPKKAKPGGGSSEAPGQKDGSPSGSVSIPGFARFDCSPQAVAVWEPVGAATPASG